MARTGNIFAHPLKLSALFLLRVATDGREAYLVHGAKVMGLHPLCGILINWVFVYRLYKQA